MEIQIDQQCHGYKGGHQALGSSVKLKREDQDALDRMSDISGPLRPDEKFSPYLTTYLTPSGSFYVVARTWQDLEARRPGCVLTRSFLIRSDDWTNFSNLNGLVGKFLPIDREDLQANSFKIESYLDGPLPTVDISNTIELVEALFLEERQPIVVFGAEDSELIIIRLLAALWPGRKRSFSTCSFALGPRMAPAQSFDLVFSLAKLRSRFANWEGRRIDGTGRRNAEGRHRWSLATARRIFQDEIPELSKFDTLGILAEDNTGDGSRLRLVLLWNDLIEQSRESPTAVLGMLDILHTQVIPPFQGYRDIGIAISRALEMSRQMTPSDRLTFLVPLCIKLNGVEISLQLCIDLMRSCSSSTSQDTSKASSLLSTIIPDDKFTTRLLFAGIGRGISMNPSSFLKDQEFSVLSDDQILLLLASSRFFARSLVRGEPASRDVGWIQRLSKSISDPSNGFAPAAIINVATNLVDGGQAALLRACLMDVSPSRLIQILDALWLGSRFNIADFDAEILAIANERQALPQMRSYLSKLPELPSTTRLLSQSVEGSFDDIIWIFQENDLSLTRTRDLLLVFLQRAANSTLRQLSQNRSLVDMLLGAIAVPPDAKPALEGFLKVLVWSDLPVDLVIVRALPMLKKAVGDLHGECLRILVPKGLRSAEPSINALLEEMIHDHELKMGADDLIASSVSPSSSPERIGDNLVILNRSPAVVRHAILDHIDDLSIRLIQNIAGRLDRNGVVAWSALIADSVAVNPSAQLRAAGATLSFALSQPRLNVSPLIVATFPVVYRVLKHGEEELSLWSIFFSDWDRCKVMRKELTKSFSRSTWPPEDFLNAAIPTGDLEHMLKLLTKDDAGKAFLNSLLQQMRDLNRPDGEQVARMVAKVLNADGSHRK
jgi:hypothetical protein